MLAPSGTATITPAQISRSASRMPVVSARTPCSASYYGQVIAGETPFAVYILTQSCRSRFGVFAAYTACPRHPEEPALHTTIIPICALHARASKDGGPELRPS